MTQDLKPLLPLIIAGLIGAIIRALKSDSIPIDIPPRWRPLVSLLLGSVAGVADLVVAGSTWQQALLTTVIAGALPIAGHETVGKLAELVKKPPSPPTGGAAVGLVALLLTGCASPALERFAAAGGRFAIQADARLLPAYKAELAACLTGPEPKACVSAVRSKWSPLRSSMAELRDAWCAFEPPKCPVKGGDE